MDAANLQVLKTQYKDYQPNTVILATILVKKHRMRKKRMWCICVGKRKRSRFVTKGNYKAIEKANKAINGIHTELEFSIHEKSKEIMVKVIDSETKEVIREIPPEKILDMVAAMLEWQES